MLTSRFRALDSDFRTHCLHQDSEPFILTLSKFAYFKPLILILISIASLNLQGPSVWIYPHCKLQASRTLIMIFIHIDTLSFRDLNMDFIVYWLVRQFDSWYPYSWLQSPMRSSTLWADFDPTIKTFDPDFNPPCLFKVSRPVILTLTYIANFKVQGL